MTDIRAICNLTDEQYEARRSELREGLISRVRGREELSDGLALSFEPTPEMREELDAFVTFERECCPGLGFSLEDSSGTLRLEIRGIDPGASVFDGIGRSSGSEHPGSVMSRARESGSENAGSNTTGSRGWLRVVRSAGLGAIGAFVLFCVVPIGLVALLGAQLAPLGALDDPWAVGAGTLVFGGLLWRRERRREAVRASAGSCGC